MDNSYLYNLFEIPKKAFTATAFTVTLLTKNKNISIVRYSQIPYNLNFKSFFLLSNLN